MTKTLYIIAGANGSGKTTFAMTYAKLKNLHFINADEIAKEYDPNDLDKYKMKAGKEFFRQLKMYIEEKEESFIIETTLSGKYLEKVIVNAKQKKFKMVDNYLIFFNGDDNYELVAEDEEILDEDLYRLFLKGFES